LIKQSKNAIVTIKLMVHMSTLVLLNNNITAVTVVFELVREKNAD